MCRGQNVSGTVPTCLAPPTVPPSLQAAVPNVPCTPRENDWLGDFSGFPDSFTGALGLLIPSGLAGAVHADVCWVITIPVKPVCFWGP